MDSLSDSLKPKSVTKPANKLLVGYRQRHKQLLIIISCYLYVAQWDDFHLQDFPHVK